MPLEDIAAGLPATTEEQHDDDGDRFADDTTSDDLQQRSMEEYDGGWSADH